MIEKEIKSKNQKDEYDRLIEIGMSEEEIDKEIEELTKCMRKIVLPDLSA